MSLLYLTADLVGTLTGGGAVTFHESEALKSLGDCQIWDRTYLEKVKKFYLTYEEPWQWDTSAYAWLDEPGVAKGIQFKLCHVYAGTFGNSVGRLQEERGCKVSYTAAAHSVEISREEHERLGFTFPSHLTDPNLWKRYLQGYLLADLLICPSSHSANVMKGFGYEGKLEIIPHGCHVPEVFQPYPNKMTYGYLGAYGPDKGIPYLLQAWKEFNDKDSTLILGGRDSTSPYVIELVRHFAGGMNNIQLAGWYENVSDFYNSISCLVQSSVTEGFGLEVLEAYAHGRPVLCSTGVGASDIVPEGWKFPARDVNRLVDRMILVKDLLPTVRYEWAYAWRDRAKLYTWDKIRERYVSVWKSLLSQ